MAQETIERVVRPILQADGGDIELIDIDGDRLWSPSGKLRGLLRFKGHLEIHGRGKAEGACRRFADR